MLKLVFQIMQQKQILTINLANLKTEGDKLDIDKLVPIPVDLSFKMILLKKMCIIN